MNEEAPAVTVTLTWVYARHSTRTSWPNKQQRGETTASVQGEKIRVLQVKAVKHSLNIQLITVSQYSKQAINTRDEDVPCISLMKSS